MKYFKSPFRYSILITLLVCASASAASFTGQVVGVIDGDTIDVLNSGKAKRIRLNGIDCPEKKQAYGTKAKQFTADLAFRKTVTVVYSDTDRYGRIIGEVFFTDGRNLSHEIVKAGYAWWYRKYAPDDKELEALEEAARGSQKGLWADPNPMPPWNFRRGAGSTSTYKSEQPRTPPDIIVYVTKTGKKYHRDGYRY